MEKCLYSVFSVLIDAFFDDETEYKRLINMVNGITSKEAKDEFDATAKSFMEDLQWAEEKLARSNARVHELGVENAEFKAEVARLTAALNGK